MLDIEKAKQQASTLADYLVTIGKKLKHTHALEAIARIHGHRSWNTLQSEASSTGAAPRARVKPTGQDLADLFNTGEVSYVMLNDERFDIHSLDYDRLRAMKEIVEGTHPTLDDDVPSIELFRNEDGLVYERDLYLDTINKATYKDGTWTLPLLTGEKLELVLYATVRFTL